MFMSNYFFQSELRAASQRAHQGKLCDICSSCSFNPKVSLEPPGLPDGSILMAVQYIISYDACWVSNMYRAHAEVPESTM